MLNLPNDEQQYLDLLCQSVVRILGRENLVGIYLFGSGSQGSYIKGKSDLDVQAVIKRELIQSKKMELAQALSHWSLPCPATKLEFVLYNSLSLKSADRPIYDINLNTGRKIEEHCSYDGTEDPWFWFALDIAIGRKHGKVLKGESISNAFPEIPVDQIYLAMLDCMNWFIKNYPDDPGCADCARRCLVYLETGEMVSKWNAKSFFGALPYDAQGGQDLIQLVLQRLNQLVTR